MLFCNVCGLETTEPLVHRSPEEEVCAECADLGRRYDPETGCMIARRETGYVDITLTFWRDRQRRDEATAAKRWSR